MLNVAIQRKYAIWEHSQNFCKISKGEKVGDAPVMLETRASQDRTDQKSKIFTHIQYCREYNKKLAD